MTESELVDKLETESSRRKKEIGNLKLDVQELPAANSADAFLQACVVLLFAHLEGFVKDSSRQYLRFLEARNADLQGLSKKWLERGSVVSVARLREIVWCMRMDYGPFRRKEFVVARMKNLRDPIAHGERLGENVQLGRGDIQQMADEVLEIVESFKIGLIELAEQVRPK